MGTTMAHGLILDTQFLNLLQQQAVQEGLITTKTEVNDRLDRSQQYLVEKCLQSILVYGPALSFSTDDELFVDTSKFTGLGLCTLGGRSPNGYPIYKGDNPSQLKVSEILQELKFLRRFVTPYLYQIMKDYLAGDTLIDKAFGLSYSKLGPKRMKAFIDSLPELAVHYALGTWDAARLEKLYSPDAVTFMEVSFLDETVVPLILLWSNEAKVLIRESHARGLPILSNVIRPHKSAMPHPNRYAPDEITILNYALDHAGLELPRVTTIEQLLSLQNDDRVLSFRHQISELLSEVREGNFGAVHGLQRRVKEATHGLQSVSKYRRRMRWTWMIPIATGLVETVLGILPTVSIATSLGLATGDFIMSKQEERHKWIWLFPQKL